MSNGTTSNKKINSLTIININKKGNCFDENEFKNFYLK